MDTIRIMYAVGGILLALISIPMVLGWVPPNPIYGFRVPGTLENRDLWYAVNKYAGKYLLVTGLLSTVGALAFYHLPGISLDSYAWACLAIVMLGLILAFVQGMRYLASLKH
jgi:uncharacterized membrane protein